MSEDKLGEVQRHPYFTGIVVFKDCYNEVIRLGTVPSNIDKLWIDMNGDGLDSPCTHELPPTIVLHRLQVKGLIQRLQTWLDKGSFE